MMESKVNNSESICKLKNLIREKYQRDLVLKSLVLMPELNNTETRVVDGNLIVPIWVQNRYFATAEICNVSDFTEQEIETITSLIKLILEPTFLGWYFDHLNNNTSVSKLSNPMQCLFIEGKNSYEITKAASRAHDLSSNWAYLQFKDVVNSNTTIEEIWAMGRITLFVDDILSLSPHQKLLMLNLLRYSHFEDGPFLILGSIVSLEELEFENLIPKDLIAFFKQQKKNSFSNIFPGVLSLLDGQ